MDFKQAGNLLYLVGETRDEMGGSHYALVNNLKGGAAPTMNVGRARETFLALHSAIEGRLVRACHDLSEGGVAVAAAEMAFAGGLGARIVVENLAADSELNSIARLFSESNSRFLCEVAPDRAADFERSLTGVAFAKIGDVVAEPWLTITGAGGPLIDVDIAELKSAWKSAFL
jgi:phosphoribosylformylglycinamidine synthase